MPQMILNITPELQQRVSYHAMDGQETPEQLAVRLLEEYVDDCDDAERIGMKIDSGEMKVYPWSEVRSRLELVIEAKFTYSCASEFFVV